MELSSEYKQTEAGMIPVDWQVLRFCDHFRIYAGGDVPKESLSHTQSEDHPYPIFANALQNKGLYGFTNVRRGKPDSVTITARGYLGHAEYREEAFFPIVRLLVLEPNGSLDSKYTTYAINDRVAFSIESTGVPQLTAPQVGKYVVAAPPTLAEQRDIAAALSDVDALLNELKRLIAKKRDLYSGAMHRLLSGHTRLPGFIAPWREKRLGELGRFLKGSGVPRGEALSGEIPCIRYGEIYTTHHNVVRKFTSRISRAVSSNATRIQFRDLLFAASGETKEEIGKCVALITDVEAYAGGDIIILRPDDGNPVYLGYLMNIPQIARQKANRGQGDAVVHISAKALAAIDLLLPEEREQEAIAEVLSDMDSEIAALEAKLAKTRGLKQAMMQALLTGRVRLPFSAVEAREPEDTHA